MRTFTDIPFLPTVIHKKKKNPKIIYSKWTLILKQISNLKTKYKTLEVVKMHVFDMQRMYKNEHK